MPVMEAATRIDCHIPWPLRAKLEREFSAISPNDLRRLCQEWRRCSGCNDSGTIGNGLDRTLAFCTCAAGIELAYRKGADWPEEEIGRVHADAKSLLVESCRALGRQFAADALEAASVADSGQVLMISLASKDHSIGVTDADVNEALRRIRWDRAFRMILPGWPQPA